ncbi:MAG: HAMP domain-containing protein [Actinobacteria bacterium]|nr:MAG: HAMP domain-containing protein [Actinomycetota bacterium]
MPRLGRSSVRLWQTELFVIVIVVAIVVLSVSLSQGLQRTLTQLGETEQLTDASALASQVSPEFPLTVESRQRMRDRMREFRAIYGDDVWVYDVDGTVLDSVGTGGPGEAVLEQARVRGLADSPPYSHMDLVADGWVIAAKAVYDRDGRRAATVVIASPVTDTLSVLDAVRRQLWTTFWIALAASGLLGLVFSEFIGRRVRRMSEAAAAIADGDFDQRLATGLVPDEIHELAESYNRMAAKLGEAFSALREREQEIATVVESLAEGVVAFDAAGTVRVINPEAAILFGLPEDREGLVGGRVTDLTRNPVILDVVDNALAGNRVSATAVLGERTVLLHGTPIDPADGHADGAVLLMGDVTEQKRIEEAQRRFVADASHEMRTPIAALQGLLELLTGGAKDDAEVRDDFLKTMSQEVERLGRLVADLLTLAQLEGGSLRLAREPVPVVEMLEELATVMQPLADRRGVALAVESPDGPLEADCDRDRIMQVLLGFVDNAVKHSATGETVTMSAALAAGRVRLSVTDRGPGIDPDAVPHLFDRFYRADQSRATRGTGLGLAIAKEIVEAHGSAITVTSSRGDGSTFSFDLPPAA